MCDVTWSLLPGMGCRSTKHLNSVADDAVKEQVVLNDGSNSVNQENKKIKKVNGKNNQKDLKNNIGRSIVRTSHHKGNIPYSQSQLDFFEMLDKKIMAGKDYACDEEQQFPTDDVR